MKLCLFHKLESKNFGTSIQSTVKLMLLYRLISHLCFPWNSTSCNLGQRGRDGHRYSERHVSLERCEARLQDCAENFASCNISSDALIRLGNHRIRRHVREFKAAQLQSQAACAGGQTKMETLDRSLSIVASDASLPTSNKASPPLCQNDVNQG